MDKVIEVMQQMAEALQRQNDLTELLVDELVRVKTKIGDVEESIYSGQQ